jgi:hypothetical protein
MDARIYLGKPELGTLAHPCDEDMRPQGYGARVNAIHQWPPVGLAAAQRTLQSEAFWEAYIDLSDTGHCARAAPAWRTRCRGVPPSSPAMQGRQDCAPYAAGLRRSSEAGLPVINGNDPAQEVGPRIKRRTPFRLICPQVVRIVVDFSDTARGMARTRPTTSR